MVCDLICEAVARMKSSDWLAPVLVLLGAFCFKTRSWFKLTSLRVVVGVRSSLTLVVRLIVLPLR
jgi:hypothetical protein